jgi:hypothetical protein
MPGPLGAYSAPQAGFVLVVTTLQASSFMYHVVKLKKYLAEQLVKNRIVGLAFPQGKSYSFLHPSILIWSLKLEGLNVREATQCAWT